jgi:hypothetical protein
VNLRQTVEKRPQDFHQGNLVFFAAEIAEFAFVTLSIDIVHKGSLKNVEF